MSETGIEEYEAPNEPESGFLWAFIMGAAAFVALTFPLWGV